MNRLEHTLDLGPADLFPLAREAICRGSEASARRSMARPS